VQQQLRLDAVQAILVGSLHPPCPRSGNAAGRPGTKPLHDDPRSASYVSLMLTLVARTQKSPYAWMASNLRTYLGYLSLFLHVEHKGAQPGTGAQPAPQFLSRLFA